MSTQVQESFGFDFAEDQAENTDLTILGERRLKEEFIRSYKPTATVLEGKPYPVFQEVQEKKLLSGALGTEVSASLQATRLLPWPAGPESSWHSTAKSPSHFPPQRRPSWRYGRGSRAARFLASSSAVVNGSRATACGRNNAP